jgi:thiamine-monophosphate kinase
LAAEHNCHLVGGDTTQGPLNICITVFGEVPKQQALLRSGAKACDDIYVSGTVGDARLALEHLRGNVALPDDLFAQARIRMETPIPRVVLGMALRGIASSAIDISDGLLGDLGHILKQSAVGAVIDTSNAPKLIAIQAINTPANRQFSLEKQLEYVLAGGDDYELVFTAPLAMREAVQAASIASETKVTRIGSISAELGLRLVDANGQSVANDFGSFDHFK